MRLCEALQLGSKFGNIQPKLENSVFKSICWLNGSFLGVMIRVF
jgi:hypothetical protein